MTFLLSVRLNEYVYHALARAASLPSCEMHAITLGGKPIKIIVFVGSNNESEYANHIFADLTTY